MGSKPSAALTLCIIFGSQTHYVFNLCFREIYGKFSNYFKKLMRIVKTTGYKHEITGHHKSIRPWFESLMKDSAQGDCATHFGSSYSRTLQA